MSHSLHTKQELLTLPDLLRLECKAMAKHVLSTGLKIPSSTMPLLEEFINNCRSAEHNPETCPPSTQTPTDNSGVPLLQLLLLHELLAQIIKPALPGSVLFIQMEEVRSSMLLFLGPVPLVRRLMLVSMFSLVCFIWLSTFPEVNGKINWSMDWGHKLLVNELFIIAAAALGATFSSLFKVHRYIQEGTFNHKFEYIAWIRLSLGIVAGTILAILIPINDASATLSKPLLSMLGGFSVELVHILLDRMIVTVGTLVNGDNKDVVTIEARNSQIKAEEQMGKSQLQLAAKLMTLKSQMDSSVDANQLRNLLDQLLVELIPTGFEQSPNKWP